MKTIDLGTEQRSLSDVLTLAKSEPVLIRTPAGEAFLLEPADEFDNEVAALGSSQRFMAFLEERAKESGDLPLKAVRKKRGM